MKRPNGKPLDVTEVLPIVENSELRDSQNESHQMALHRPLTILGKGEVSTSNLTDFHLTVRLTHETLSRREISLLTEVLAYQCIHFGINLTMYLVLTDMYFKLLGNKFRATEIKEGKLRLTLTVVEVLLRLCAKFEFPADCRQVVLLGNIARNVLSEYVMSKRTYASRYRTWRPEKFFVIRAVPVDIQFLTRSKNTTPYSGYCKGYGESHPSAHKRKTKPSAELDGDGSNPVTSAEEFLFIRCTDPIHLLSESLLIKYRNGELED